jgi:hypothetical protein
LPTLRNFNKPYHSIQLISIGIVAEDGREIYLISNEYNPNDADDWVKENVLLPIFNELKLTDSTYDVLNEKLEVINSFNKKHFSFLLSKYGKSNKEIAYAINHFVKLDKLMPNLYSQYKGEKPEFYAYYADYDWVVFCSLFGRMVDLPSGFPMYCKDLKQMLDEKVFAYDDKYTNDNDSFESKMKSIKNKYGYPEQDNEHNALEDAKWNMKLFDFLKSI